MQWATYEFQKDSQQTQEIESFQYAGPLRIPPPVFQIRSRKEVGAIDAINARYIENTATALKQTQETYERITSRKEEFNEAGDLVTMSTKDSRDSRDPFNKEREILTLKTKSNPFFDMAPLSSRTDVRDFRQSKPYDSSGPNLSLNPFFDRYDPTRDPRNMIREVRSVVYELKESDRGIKESERIRQRTFTNRTNPEGSTSISITEWQDLLRPKIDNIEVVYRPQGGLWALGSKDGLQDGSVRPPKP
jgi:hypothetical protein